MSEQNVLVTVLDRIAAADPGPEVVACFEYEGTVIGGSLEPLGELEGRDEEELVKLGSKAFKNDVGSRLHLEVWELIQAHRDRGHTVVLVSSATRFDVEPMAAEMDAQHVLCTSMEVRGGRLTGRVEGRPLRGAATAEALAALATEHDFDLNRSFAYGSWVEDLPVLRAVGNPVAVEPEDALRDFARREGWPVIACVARGGRPGITDVVRTTAMYGGVLGGLGLGAGIGVLKRSRTKILDRGGSIGADIGLTLAGIRVDVVHGRENLWSARPAVFIFNHQSKLDPIVVMKLLREQFTGVGKKEVKKVPVFGQLFQLAGVALVDRADSGSARKALEPAVRRIRDDRMSLCIAPEGTRSVTPRLGPFKKGAFHIAMQAEVPIVPIVLRNVGEVMWRGAQVVKPGRVEVCVLDPVDTSEWTVEGLDEHVAAVRGQFVETLAHWPGRARSSRSTAGTRT